MTWGWALAGGLCGAGLVVGLSALHKSRQLEVRALHLQKSLEERGSSLEAYLLSKGSGIGPELAQMTREGAEREATYYLATRYGLTPDLVARLQQLPRLP